MRKRYCDVCGREITIHDSCRGNTYHTFEELKIDKDTCMDCRGKVETVEAEYLVERKMRDMAFIKKTFPINYQEKWECNECKTVYTKNLDATYCCNGGAPRKIH